MKYQVVHNAAVLFRLTDQEAETLANKAGLTLYSDKPFSDALEEILQKYGIKGSSCYKRTTISERMYQYIAKGRKPTKETVLALSLSLDLKLEEIEMLLKNAGYVFSKALPNDMVIFYMLTHRQECKAPLLFHVNEVLQELELPLLVTR
ncbi:MAG: hypothetical protein HDT30_13670 [Clostridiales bacterium]|nr:hypothetical protein [Clostridiales bacterium]